MTRARGAASARPRPDRTRASRSDRWSVVSTSDVDGMRHHIMSPEQARGKPVDKRADIWAFGCVLYEMLTGQRAFEGEDVSETLARVIEREPRWDALPVRTSAAVRKLLARCLEKSLRRRLRDIGDGLVELDDASQPVSTELPAGVRRAHRLWRRVLPAVLSAGAAGVIVGLTVWSWFGR